MALTAILSVLANPGTQAAAVSLIQMASSAMRLVEDMNKPEMTQAEKDAQWVEIKALMQDADEHLNRALKNHPAWTDAPSSELPEPE